MTDDESLTPQSSRRILRRVGAVFAGLVFIVILDAGFDLLMHTIGVFPPWGWPMPTNLWLLAIAYRAIDSIGGSYIAAVVAPDRPRAHALVLGAIGVLLSTVGLLATWNKDPDFGPKWYPAALVVIALPCAFIGGTLRERQLKS
jgi:hypothetical protein